MKFLCTCGHVIDDGTDYIPYKAHVISDQDIYEAAEVSARGSESWVVALTRRLYECIACGRLWLEGPGRELAGYKPEVRAGTIIAPAAGDSWKALLRARWNDQPLLPGMEPGWLSCARGNKEQVRSFSEWPALEAAYYETLESRRAEGTLRDASLSKNDVLVHHWDLEE